MENIIYVVATNSFFADDVEDTTTVQLFLQKKDAIFNYNILKQEFLNEIQTGEYITEESVGKDDLSFCAYLDGRYEEDHYTINLWAKPVQEQATLEQKAYEWYLKEWAADHSNSEFEGMNPVCFNEFVDNEFAEAGRVCHHCGKMYLRTGYVIEGGDEYYCSDECLHAHYTHEQFLELYDEGNGDSYYTEWDDEDNDDSCSTEGDDEE